MDLRRNLDTFELVQVGIAVGIGVLAWIFFRPKSPESGFRLREADRPRKPANAGPATQEQLRTEARLLLSGFRADLPPHELLGVRADADEAQIRQAFREKMKQYHPDRVAPVGTPEWREAQKISQALEEARSKLLEAIRVRR